MSRNSRPEFIFVLIVILILVFFGYPKYKAEQAYKAKLALDNKAYQLGQLVLVNHDCATVINEAKAFLKIQDRAEPIWNVLGACQFDTGKFDDAKVSFQKVLSFNPNNQGAKTYLNILSKPPSTTVVQLKSLSKNNFESISGLKFDEKKLYFNNAGERSDSPSTYYASVTYIAPTENSFSQTRSYLKEQLTKIGLTLKQVGDDASHTVLSATAKNQIYYFTVIKGSPVKVVIDYTKLK